MSFPLISLVLMPLAALVTVSTRGRSQAAWAAVGIGLLSWVVAEAIWAYDALIFHEQRFPSWGEVAYMLFVPAMATGLLLFPSGRSWRGQGRVILDGTILTLSFFLIAWLAVLRTLWRNGGVSGLRFAVELAYPAGDFLILTLAFLVLLRVAPGQRLTFTLLVGAFACVSVADSVWVYLSNSGGYQPGSLPDIFTAAAGLLIIVALVAAYHAVSGTDRIASTHFRHALWLPLVPLTVAGIFVAAAPQNVVLEPPVVIGATLLIAATLVRQVLEASEAVRREQQIRRLADQLATDLESAARYVASILPGELDGPVQVSSRYLPSRAVGGDSFGYEWIGDDSGGAGPNGADHLIVYLIDVSGHGVEPALLSVSVHNLLRSGSLPDETLLQPDLVLAELNDFFSMESNDDHYFTMWCGVYQLSTGVLRYANAGHPPALALNGDGGTVTATALGGGSMPVGMFGGVEFPVESYRVRAGDRILLYSDGVLGEPPRMAEFVDLCTGLIAEQSFTLDALAEKVPVITDDHEDEDDRSLVLMTVPG